MDKSLIAKYVVPRVPLKTELRPGGYLCRPVRAILFDIYGTLFISASGGSEHQELEADREAHLQRLLRKYELPVTTTALLSEYQRAIDARHAELRVRGIEYPEVDIEDIWRQALPSIRPGDIRPFAVEFEFIVNPVYPMPNLKSFLFACGRQTAVMGIISNAQFYTRYLFEWLLNADLSRFGFDPELVIWSYLWKRAKPAAELFEQTAARLRKMGISPQHALFVGNDMLKDIYPARNCGFQTALFAGDNRSLRMRREDARCRRIRPDLIITELSQLFRHLGA